MFLAALWPILTAFLAFVFRQIVVKFLVLAAVFAVVAMFLPMVWNLVAPYAGIKLGDYFSALPGGVWYFLDFARLDVGLPLIFSAIIARFTIRRLPFVG
jgi:hypothetical protein